MKLVVEEEWMDRVALALSMRLRCSEGDALLALLRFVWWRLREAKPDVPPSEQCALDAAALEMLPAVFRLPKLPALELQNALLDVGVLRRGRDALELGALAAYDAEWLRRFKARRKKSHQRERRRVIRGPSTAGTSPALSPGTPPVTGRGTVTPLPPGRPPSAPRVLVGRRRKNG